MLLVLSLPTRDGNSIFYGEKTQKGSVLSLPTRDGNCPAAKSRLSSTGRFKPTYKGWKQFYVEPFPASLERFKPTYKGWKPI